MNLRTGATIRLAIDTNKLYFFDNHGTNLRHGNPTAPRQASLDADGDVVTAGERRAHH